MQQKISGIVLRIIKHSDTHSVVTVFSRESGCIAFLSPSGSTREAARRRALLTPFSVIEGVADIRAGKDLATIKDLTRKNVRDFSINPVKGIIALFISDVLHTLLREQQPDSVLYDFLEASSDKLGGITNKTAVANFHIAFLLGLIRLLGFEPDCSTYSIGKIFDLRDGVWRSSAPLHNIFLDPVRSGTAYKIISKMNMQNMHFYKFTRNERNEITDIILQYISLHMTSLANIKSLDIVRSLF